MCGIAGYVDFSSKTNPSVIKKMTDEIFYRGPDSSGKYVSKNNIAGLGIRRLSIIDLKTGDQPIKNEDGSVVVVYNGEIYNYQELRKELEARGHQFRTQSDTEVLVHGYEEWGLEFIKKLNGMFAFALWDEKKQKLTLGRDGVGIKPLYYFQQGKVLVFGSELKTILKYLKSEKSSNLNLDLDSLNLYLYLGFLPREKTMFKGISKLLPGYSLTFGRSGLRTEKYFQIATENNGKTLDELLEDSVKRQLVADVPVGVFLSGGLDSSLIAFYISKFKKLKSFSIGFKESGFDESKYAHYVAKMIGTEHYSEEFKSKDVIEIFKDVTEKLDEPLADASLIPTYKVSRLARKQVTVVLSGDGADELFGGYPTYQAHILARYLDFLPGISLDLIANFLDILPKSLINLIPLSFKDYPKKELAKIVLKGMKLENPERHLYWMSTFFLGDKINKSSGKEDQILHGLYSDIGKTDSRMNIGQQIDFNSYLVDDFLVKVDRASMYNSLEVRVPYLDKDVVNYAFTTDKPQVDIFKTKIQLRELLRKYLPETAKRYKKGFGIPLEKWLKGDLKEFARSYLENKKLNNYISKNKIQTLWEDHQSGHKNSSGAIWQLVVLSGWLNNYL